MIILNNKEWKNFLILIEKGLKRPTTLVPTPKLLNAARLVQEDLIKKEEEIWLGGV